MKPALEHELLDAARLGDEHAYARLVAPHRAELHTHCRRMLGSAHDADDALQDTLLRAWGGLAGFEGRSSLRAWLYRIATNCCLSTLHRRSARAAPAGPAVEAAAADGVDGGGGGGAAVADPSVDPLEAQYEQREGVELAFIAAHQHLPARQRAVLILREALGFSACEVAASLDTTTASVNSALQRARATVAARRPDHACQVTLDALTDADLRASVRRYADAWARADVDGVVAMLAAEAA
jgi:RNA polymerase sigma-70 factor (ECF subfamily)